MAAATDGASTDAMVIQRPGTSAGTPQVSRAPSREVLQAIDGYFAELARQDRLSGAVLISRNGVTLFERGYGLANRATGERITPSTRFNLGSMDKFMTRAAIFQLVGAGRLSMDAAVGEILPGYPNRDVREKVTVRHLVEMTSGVPNYWGERYEARRTALRTTDDFLALFADQPLQFEPGTRTAYSNGGYILLGKIIEQISGLSFSDYLSRHITGPARMRSTSLAPPSPGARGYAVGYTRLQRMGEGRASPTGPLRRNDFSLPGWGSSAGGGYSTVRDFARLDAALRAGRLLGAGTRLQLTERFLAGSSCSVGWTGGAPGVNTSLSLCPDGTTVIIFLNRDPPLADAATSEVLRLLGRASPTG